MKKLNYDSVPEFPIRMAYVPYTDQKFMGKYRPVVILKRGRYLSKVMGVTSRYHGKENWIKEYLFVLTDWKAKHFDRPSYIDVSSIHVIPNDCFVPLSVTTSYLPLNHRESYLMLQKRKFYVRARNRFNHTHTYYAHWLRSKYTKRYNYNTFNFKNKNKNAQILEEFD